MHVTPIFLTLADVIGIHADQIEHYGGQSGLRELSLLQSAVAMPKGSFGGEWLHRDLFEMAAAYAFHISQNQSFNDGNKRTGLACALLFLEINEVVIDDSKGRLYQAMMNVANGTLDKLGLAGILRSLPRT